MSTQGPGLVMALLIACLQPAFAAELAGSGWRLVQIMSMDDSVYTPEDPQRYTLEFGEDGRASIGAGCNHGVGSWTSERPGQVGFGPIAGTRALCAPGSLSERYLAQFEWVRTYVKEEGHLFLATMADGAIVEFEPLPPPVATVLGESVRGLDAATVRSAVLTPLFAAYADVNGLAATEAEIEAFLEDLHRGKRELGLDATEELTPEEAQDLAAMEQGMARSLIERWKLNKSLYETYGGRIALQQFGPEPLDAYRSYLEERHTAGDFSFHDPSVEARFWRYFRDHSLHNFLEAESEEERQTFQRPPWERTP